MSSEYPKAPIGKVAKVRSGFAFKSSDWQNDGIPVVKIANVKDGRLEMDGCSYVSNEVALTAKDFLLDEGDILISMTGYVGDLARVRIEDTPCALNQRVGRFHSYDRELIEPSFLFFHLRSKEIRGEIEQKAYGSAQPNISAGGIEETCIYLPELKDQQAIAHILGTLDDKIELNRKTNETLEAMAKALFKSWFVDFDPVRAKAEGRPTGLPAEISDLFPDSFEDSELGEIPSGWNVAELGDISTISGGKQLESVELKSKGRFPVYGANGTMGFRDLATHNSFVIVFGRVGAYCGSINWEYGGAWVNNNASSVIPLRYNELVLQWMLEADYSNYRTGSAQPFIPNGALACSPVLMPTDALASVFCDLLLPIRLKQKKNQSAALSLAEIRDALLPKLISGEIRIPDAEKMLEEVGV